MLLEKGFQVRCLIRNTSDLSPIPANQVELCEGDLDDYAGLVRAFDGIDALVNVASLGFGHAPNVVSACTEAGCKRAIFISTTAIFTKLNAASKTTRLHAEDLIKKSGLQFTILRPTMIYGSARDRNLSRLIRFLRTSPFVFIPGTGEALQQPVHVCDVASTLANVVHNTLTYGNCYNIPGAAPLTFKEIINTISSLLGKRHYVFSIPTRPILKLMDMLESKSIQLPIKAEQVRRLEEDKAFTYEKASKDFGYSPMSFKDGIAKQINQMYYND